jgi:hypothetical protein
MLRVRAAYLCGDSVASCREELGDASRLETTLGETESGAETGTSGTTVVYVSESNDDIGNQYTHTTIASYSCSMSGYLPEVQL